MMDGGMAAGLLAEACSAPYIHGIFRKTLSGVERILYKYWVNESTTFNKARRINTGKEIRKSRRDVTWLRSISIDSIPHGL
jgi:hypothetical protein